MWLGKVGWGVVNLFHIHLPCFGGVGWCFMWWVKVWWGVIQLSVVGCDVVESLMYFIWWGWVGLGDS